MTNQPKQTAMIYLKLNQEDQTSYGLTLFKAFHSSVLKTMFNEQKPNDTLIIGHLVADRATLFKSNFDCFIWT